MSDHCGPIMKSLEPTMSSINLYATENIEDQTHESIHLFGDSEVLLVHSEDEFIRRLEIKPNQKVKVVAIFGNTGDGKSYSLNHAFFGGKEVFRTSRSQRSCTIGVWAKFDPKLNAICLDTEGLLGTTNKEYQRTRLLLKILAVSDLVIYRTKAERLLRDMYTFLGGASKAYKEHFSAALQNVCTKYGVDGSATTLAPSVIIFHETEHTEPLNSSPSVTNSPEEELRENFRKVDQSWDGFSSLKYLGFKRKPGESFFKELRMEVEKELDNSKVRSPRDPKYVYKLLKGLNEKFQSPISNASPQLYLPAFFTCQDKCLSCGANCSLSMGHKDEGEVHLNKGLCKMQHQYQNFVYLCKQCHLNGTRQRVEPSYQTRTEQFWSSIFSSVWSGYVIECPKCGVIYKSREYWYGNKDPKDEAVLIDIVHVWPGERSLLGSYNSGQRVLDGVTSITNVVANVGSQPTKIVGAWVTDQINPKYWRPNSEILECFRCKTSFSSNSAKHHCRACGEGFCESCSSKSQPVPSRGWYENVRVCDNCYNPEPPSLNHIADGTEVRSRRIGETVISSISAVKSVLDIPKEMIKETVRPTYWTPDSECVKCAVCDDGFGPLLSLHHCRDCGKGVCDKCSNSRKPVPLRGWDAPVRVCDNCSG